jgi:hypothetical protein
MDAKEIPYQPEKPTIIPPTEPPFPIWPQTEPEIHPEVEPTPQPAPAEIPTPPKKRLH